MHPEWLDRGTRLEEPAALPSAAILGLCGVGRQDDLVGARGRAAFVLTRVTLISIREEGPDPALVWSMPFRAAMPTPCPTDASPTTMWGAQRLAAVSQRHVWLRPGLRPQSATSSARGSEPGLGYGSGIGHQDNW